MEEKFIPEMGTYGT